MAEQQMYLGQQPQSWLTQGGGANFFGGGNSIAAQAPINTTGLQLPTQQYNAYNMGGNTQPTQQVGGADWLSKLGGGFAGLFGGTQNNVAAQTPSTGLGAAGWGNIIGAGAALGNAYFASQALKQGKKEFAFNKSLAERNLGNQAQLINTGQERRARSNAASLGLSGQGAQDFITNRVDKESVRGTV